MRHNAATRAIVELYRLRFPIKHPFKDVVTYPPIEETTQRMYDMAMAHEECPAKASVRVAMERWLAGAIPASPLPASGTGDQLPPVMITSEAQRPTADAFAAAVATDAAAHDERVAQRPKAGTK